MLLIHLEQSNRQHQTNHRCIPYFILIYSEQSTTFGPMAIFWDVVRKKCMDEKTESFKKMLRLEILSTGIRKGMRHLMMIVPLKVYHS